MARRKGNPLAVQVSAEDKALAGEAGLARRPGESAEPQTFTMRHLDDLSEEIKSGVQPLIMALSTGRPELLKLYKPTEPLPAAEAVNLMNAIRVLMNTNAQLKAYGRQMEGHIKELTGLIADMRQSQLKQLELMRKSLADYKPLIGPQNDGD